MKTILAIIFFFSLSMCCYSQQQFRFHPSQMEADSIHDPALGTNGGYRQRITGPLPAIILKALVYDDISNIWEIFTGRVEDQTGLSWQNREILRDGDLIDIDEKGYISIESKKE